MSIFGNKDREDEPRGSARLSFARERSSARHATLSSPAGRTGHKSFLGPRCRLKGEFAGDGSLECVGRFDGTVDISGDVIVGHGGRVKAELRARRINIEGSLKGNATASEKVEVGSAGHVEGDVRAPAVQFAEGAFFEGNVEMRRAREETDSEGDAAAERADGDDRGSAKGSAR